MNRDNQAPGPKEKKAGDPMDAVPPDMTPRREGGDDSLAESSPIDERSDEKVIVNEQLSNKTVNAPSQTSVNTSEAGEETIN